MSFVDCHCCSFVVLSFVLAMPMLSSLYVYDVIRDYSPLLIFLLILLLLLLTFLFMLMFSVLLPVIFLL